MTKLPPHASKCNPHLHHQAVPLPHLRDLDEEMPNWWKKTQTPVKGLRNVSVEKIVGSASGSGWQFKPDWAPKVLDYRFEDVLDSMDKRGYDPEFDGSHIELILFQDEYWVADGHRRVSAAKNLRIRTIRAEITLLASAKSLSRAKT